MAYQLNGECSTHVNQFFKSADDVTEHNRRLNAQTCCHHHQHPHQPYLARWKPREPVDTVSDGGYHPRYYCASGRDTFTRRDHAPRQTSSDKYSEGCACCNEFDLDFAAGTTCHGINLVCNQSWNWYRRGFWLLLVMSSLALLATQLHDRFVTFLAFELKTEVAIESARNLTLPTVTLCNANFFSQRSFTSLDLDLIENITYAISSDIENDVADLRKAGALLPDNWTETYWQAAVEYEYLEYDIIQRHKNMTKEQFTVDSWLRRTGWQIAGTSKYPSPVIQCRVGKLACSADDFKPIMTPQGLCYTLTNQPARFVQKQPGALAGINIFLDTNQDDYSKYNLEGQSQFECGIKVILHEWYERPDIGQAVGIPPGMSGFVAIKGQKRIIDAEEPWSDCLVSDDPNNPYSERQCLLECSAKQTLLDCGCRLWYEPGNATLCGVARTTACLLFKELVGEDTSEEELRCKAACLEACYTTSYSASVSYTALASNRTLSQLTQELIAVTKDERFTEDYVRTNVIALQIAYAQLVTDRTSSTPALTLSAFLSDIGGQLGLFAGISLITICELIEYPLAKLVSIITGNQRLGESLRTRRKRRRNRPFRVDEDGGEAGGCSCGGGGGGGAEEFEFHQQRQQSPSSQCQALVGTNESNHTRSTLSSSDVKQPLEMVVDNAV